MLQDFIGRVDLHGHDLIREERGQSLIVVAAAIIMLMAIIGLGVDLGVAYAERVRLARAMDAAALAGAQELPAEAAAHDRALEYLHANGYDTSNACININQVGIGPCPPDAETNIWVETEEFRSGGVNSANRIKVQAEQAVRMNFVRVVGFDTVPISAQATAENIEDLDIAIVYDRSGSMQEDTRCFGCWSSNGPYPEGNTYPLPFGDHCRASDPLEHDGHYYISIEAEHYSRYPYQADYHFDWTEYPKTWWAMQRDPNENASGTDSRGAFMMVGPNSSSVMYYETLADIQPPSEFFATPRLDYDFTVPANGTYYVWIRAQGGPKNTNADWQYGRESRRRVHVGINGNPMNTGSTCFWGPYSDGASSTVRKSYDPPDGFCSTGRQGWSWSRVLQSNLTAGDVHTLNIWAAGQGFRLDKIVITDNSRGDLDDDNRPLDWSYGGVPDGGPGETGGRTDWACMGPDHETPDPRFEPISPRTGELDDLYDDKQPIRAAKEAAKKFVSRMDERLDQIGYVWYSSNADIIDELYCLRQQSEGLVGSCETFDHVIDSIESTNAGGGTNIADALWDGMRVLTTGEEPPNDGIGLPSKNPGQMHYGRPSAAHILVLMTDGQANQVPSLPSGYGNCYSDDLWPDQPEESTSQRNARECVAWFARHARDQGIVVYTIGLGGQADHELLAHVADLTGGWYYYAPDSKDLESIFDSLYERIFLRLID
jgi:Flp pilus assembly protein TadG